MLPMKIELTEKVAATLRCFRLEHPANGEVLTAEKLSKAIGNNRAWMSQIESRRLKKIKREDVIKIYKLLLNLDNDNEAEDKAEMDLIKFIKKKSDDDKKLLFSFKHHYNDDDLTPNNSTNENSNKENEKAEKQLRKMYDDDCNEILSILHDLYDSKDDSMKKNHISMLVRNLLKFLYDDDNDNSYLNLVTSIPFDLYKFATEDEKKELDSIIQTLTESLNKLTYKKELYKFMDRINYISYELEKKQPEMKLINDSIVLGVINLSNIFYEYNMIPLQGKIACINEYIKLLTLYSQINSMIFTLKCLPENECTQEDLNNALDYIQSFVNGIKDSSAYLLNHISDFYKK